MEEIPALPAADFPMCSPHLTLLAVFTPQCCCCRKPRVPSETFPTSTAPHLPVSFSLWKMTVTGPTPLAECQHRWDAFCFFTFFDSPSQIIGLLPHCFPFASTILERKCHFIKLACCKLYFLTKDKYFLFLFIISMVYPPTWYEPDIP